MTKKSESVYTGADSGRLERLSKGLRYVKDLSMEDSQDSNRK
jgi:hypothetical protein